MDLVSACGGLEFGNFAFAFDEFCGDLVFLASNGVFGVGIRLGIGAAGYFQEFLLLELLSGFVS